MPSPRSCTRRPARGTARARYSDGVDVRRVACIGAPLYTPMSPTFPLELARALREFEPDILHLHLPNPSCFAALASARARRVPWIVHWHSDIPPDAPDWRLRAAYRVYRPFEQALLKRASAIVATSQAYLDASAALAPWRAKTTRDSRSASTTSRCRSPRPDLWPAAAGLRLLAVGRLSHYKGFDVLIDALAHATHEARFCSSAKANARTRCARERSNAVSPTRIRFAGALDDDDAARRVCSSRCVRAAVAESRRSIRARAARSDARAPAGHRERDSGLGHRRSRRRRRDRMSRCAGRCRRACDCASRDWAMLPLRQRMGAAGRARWERQFTLERSAERWLALYRDLTT